MSKKKKIIIIISCVLAAIIITLGAFFINGLGSATNKTEYVLFEVKSGSSRFDIVEDLHNAGIIKSVYSANLYVLFNFDLNLQAGEYTLNRANSLTDIIKQINIGDTGLTDVINITFVEGKRVSDVAKVISDEFGYAYDDVIAIFKDKDYAKILTSKYDILTDEILDEDIYYPLEGYLYPDTYEFYRSSTIEEIIDKLVHQTAVKIGPLRENIENSGYSIHEVLTMSSIVELEAIITEDRQNVAQVIYSRLAVPMTLGMDVTSYYGVEKAMGEVLTYDDLNADNGYNTRNANFLGLPVGPICSPSFESITAVLNPSDTSDLYFVADITTGYIHFFETIDEFNTMVNILRSEGKL